MQFRGNFKNSDVELDSELLLELVRSVGSQDKIYVEREVLPLIEYSGKFATEGPVVIRRDDRGARILPIRSDLRNYSDQFNWANHTDGAKQLALALLADATSENTAILCHEYFAKKVITGLTERWVITSEEIREETEEILLEYF